jgi:hypothetical protein
VYSCTCKKSEQSCQSDAEASTNLKCNPNTKRFLERRDAQEVACRSVIVATEGEQSEQQL